MKKQPGKKWHLGETEVELGFAESGEPSGELEPVEAADLASQLADYLDAALGPAGTEAQG